MFGREAHGLFTRELDRCQELLWIPSDPACPSLNLAHSVAVVGYTLAMAARASTAREPHREELVPAPAEEIEAMFQHARRVWLRIGYLHYQNPDSILRRWRKLLGRTRVTEYEVRVIRALVHQTDWAAKVAGIPPGGVLDAPEGLFDKHRDPEDGEGPGE
jgi:tRNA/rRNA methyltransferase